MLRGVSDSAVWTSWRNTLSSWVVMVIISRVFEPNCTSSLLILVSVFILSGLTGCGQTNPTPDQTVLVSEVSPTQVIADPWKSIPVAPPGYGEQGEHILFYSDRSGAYELYQVSLSNPEVIQLTDVSALELEPSWSPDRQMMAFKSDHADEWWRIFVVDFDGGEPKQVTHFNGDSWTPTWSPDGSVLLFVSHLTGDEEIYLTDLESEPINLTQHSGAQDTFPVWSPDGSEIAFVSDREGVENIYLMSRDGSNIRRLTDFEGMDTAPNWSPDGSKIAFVSAR